MAAILATGLLASASQAVIAITDSSVPFDFSSRPVAADWSTTNTGAAFNGTASSFPQRAQAYQNFAQMDAGIATIGAADIVQRLNDAGDTSTPIPTAQRARYNNVRNTIETRPTQNRATVFMGRFQNQSGMAQGGVDISYNMFFDTEPNTGAEQLPGWRVYASFTGDVGSFQPIPELGGLPANSGDLRTASVAAPNGVWNDMAPFFLLFVDDNVHASYQRDVNGVDARDNGLWLSGLTTQSTPVVVPEPASVMILGLGALAFGIRRKR